MRFFIGLFLISVLFSSCSKSSQLEKEFSCHTNIKLTTEKVLDFYESYSVEIPKNWKTSLYYDNMQTEIFAADTTKVLENAYTMEFSMINGKMNSIESFKNKVKEKAINTGLQLIKENFIDKDKKKGYYFYGKGMQNNLEIYVFQYYIKFDNEKYFMVKTEIFGNEKVDERLCESLNIISSIEFVNEPDN